jgi:ferric-dicitrate binding protein FerR (iron transport regulator)
MNPEIQSNDKDLELQEKAIQDLFPEDRATIEKIAEVSVDQAWKKIFYRRRNMLIRKTALLTLKYAAAILVFLSAGYYWAIYKMDKKNEHIYSVVNIPNAEMGNVILPDGTKVALNASSELRYPLHFSNSREVFLTGEAFFDVKSDPRNPFVVHVENFSIKVTGTRFNVKSYPDMSPETTLEEGKITIIDHDGNAVVNLKPNENILYSKEQNRFFVTRTDTYQKTSWKEGKIVLKNQTIGEISKLVERWYNVKIKFNDETIKQERLTGTIYKDYPIEELLHVLVTSESVDFKLVREPDGARLIIFSKKR